MEGAALAKLLCEVIDLIYSSSWPFIHLAIVPLSTPVHSENGLMARALNLNKGDISPVRSTSGFHERDGLFESIIFQIPTNVAQMARQFFVGGKEHRYIFGI